MKFFVPMILTSAVVFPLVGMGLAVWFNNAAWLLLCLPGFILLG